MNLVWGDENVEYLCKCVEVLKVSLLFVGMEYIIDVVQIVDWVLVMMEGCDLVQKVVVVCLVLGMDVNFGEIIC